MFITFLTGQLNAVLPEGFAANIDERLYVTASSRSVDPDVALIERPLTGGTTGDPPGMTAIAPTASDPPVVVTLLSDPVRESFIEIRTADPASELVAVVEVLSPTNKAPGMEGAEEYRDKQRQVIASPAHLLEIDLLRGGEHVLAIPSRTCQVWLGRSITLSACTAPGRGKGSNCGRTASATRSRGSTSRSWRV
jgi:hypothetical protein